MIRHKINVSSVKEPASISIEGSVVTIGAGNWPDFDGAVAVEGVTFDLAGGDTYIYLDRDGGMVVSASFIPYGQDMAGEQHPMLDLLAWRQGTEWHVKELVYV